jgi:hypothetical protein
VSALDALQRIRSASDGVSRPRTQFRHRHIDEAPMVVVVYRLAGESAAPLGIMYGTNPADPTLLVAPEPRNREIRFREAFDPFSADLCRLVGRLAAERDGSGWNETTVNGLQVIVPNNATRDFVGPLLGRSLRYLSTEGEFAVPPSTVMAGAHLTWLGQQSELPGSSVLLSATELLRRHWVTGLSDLESEDLHVHLGWIDPPTGSTGAAAALAVEQGRGDGTVPAAGPTPDPSWDRDILDPLIEAFNHKRDGLQDDATVKRLGKGITKATREALRPTWDATWQAIELVRALPEGASVPDRWSEDRRDFRAHVDRVETGEARFRTRDSVKQAAWMVRRREDAQAALEACEALDDPLVLANAIADGTAVAGSVTEMDGREFSLELTRPCPVPAGTELFLTDLPDNASARVISASTSPPYFARMYGLKGYTKYLPSVGDHVTYAPFKRRGIKPPGMPEMVPWTHVGPDTAPAAPEVAE